MKKSILLIIFTLVGVSIISAQNHKVYRRQHVNEKRDKVFVPNTLIMQEFEEKLVFESNGDLVYYDENKALWRSNTANKDAVYFVVTKKGNIKILGRGDVLLWSADCGGKNAAYLRFKPFTDNPFRMETMEGEVVWEPTIMPGFTVKYDRAEGCGTFFMDGTELKKHCGWSKNWHSIVVIGCIGNSNDSHRVLFYDKDAGAAAMYIVDAYGNMKVLKNHSGWSKNWEKITWDDQGECKGLIKFETVDGYWEKYNCNDQGGIELHSKKI